MASSDVVSSTVWAEPAAGITAKNSHRIHFMVPPENVVERN